MVLISLLDCVVCNGNIVNTIRKRTLSEEEHCSEEEDQYRSIVT